MTIRSFNEAAAFAPRITFRPSIVREITPTGFNEAAAFAPRITIIYAPDADDDWTLQ